ncbi:hypothetical protein AB205_0110140 [Aquarana catesbeiana]|uniref:Uncharacterized protein n=1 Tax=Aquarana catesbeiana TaxID=8400 RepID=A0A2G9QFT5_AQUCT|nr:hypothetical protein AB205_0110140 [Aquarana catesbeiana]
MDPEMYQEILNYKLNKCPSGITNSAKYTIRRRAIQFEIKEGVLYRTLTNKDGIVKYTKVVTSVKEADDIFRDVLECQECQKEGTEIKAKPEHQPINVNLFIYNTNTHTRGV